ncbi:uncharacterized membrane protein YoaK (UPF0700 family) [Streptacidiphilus sp. BW17]|jgi:uncharacterized membrane protein YoaK (UPF0700 family)|uniref:YoaK family protein n=1 Tax=Streptacidiphilus sp. BW17 TaxID=3156274 RepID=UPI003516C4BF
MGESQQASSGAGAGAGSGAGSGGVREALRRAADRLFPPDGNRFGALPVLLVVLTFVTGVVDAVSYLGLGRVFVANMTGNVVFLGFSLAGAPGLSVWASLLAIGAFAAGAWLVGRFSGLREARAAGSGAAPVPLFRTVVGVQSLLVAGAVVVAGTAGHTSVGAKVALIALLGWGMGMQNAVVRRLAVPDLTTTVLTLTLTGLATDPPARAALRRVLSVTAMLCGALCGAAVFLHVGAAWALAIALVLLVAVTAVAEA